jgi:predicted acylesterase/phospholipase RssA
MILFQTELVKTSPALVPSRIAVVLSAGGLRGAAHLGVLRRLVKLGLPIDVMVGVSAGAIIAGFYAGAGLTIEDMIADAPTFRGRHILMFGLSLRVPRRVQPLCERFAGVIPDRLRQLESGRFDRLHHGVSSLAVVCHDQDGNRPHYFSSCQPQGMRLPDVARASACVPGIFQPRSFELGDAKVRLVDGGLSDALPVEFTRSALASTHIVVSDCRRTALSPPQPDANLIYIRPYLGNMTCFCSPRASLLAAVAAGEAAVTAAVEDQVCGWARQRV